MIRENKRPILRELAFAGLAAALALVGAAFVLQLWDAKLHVPLGEMQGDVTDSLMVVKMLMTSAFFQNDQIGAPFGTAMEDYPFYWDLGQVLTIKTLGIFSDSPAAVFNASYVLSYPAIAFTAFLSLRWIGASRGPAVLAAVLFAVLPFHFLRGQAHFYIAQYWAVPISAALVYKLIAGQPLLAVRADVEGRIARYRTPTTYATLLAAGLSGIQFGYYAIFTIVLIGLVLAIRLIARPARQEFVGSAFALVVTGIGFVAMLLPTLLFRSSNGTNEFVAARTPNEAELYGFKLSQLLLPIDGHRISSFAEKASEYATTAPPLGEGQSTPALGLLLGAAFVVSLVVLASAAFRPRDAKIGPTRAVLYASGLGALLTFVMGTIGGGSSLFSYLISPQLRGWGRISVFLAFFAAIALCAIVRWLLEDWRGRARPGVAVAVLTALGVLGVLDQTAKRYTPLYDLNLASWNSDGRFVAAIEKQVPPNSAILQLPYSPFPEAGSTARATDFDLFRPMLHADTLRWSYGAMRGRESDWAATSVPNRPLAEVLPEAAAAGFAGVYVDTRYFADDGAAILKELGGASGQPVQRSDDGRMAFVSLAPVAEDVEDGCNPDAVKAAGSQFLHPVRPNWGPGFQPQETDGRRTWHWAGPTARLDLAADPGLERDVRVSFQVGGVVPRSATVTVQPEGGTATTLKVSSLRAARYELVIPADGEGTRIHLKTDSPDDGVDSRDLRMRVLDLEMDRGLTCQADD